MGIRPYAHLIIGVNRPSGFHADYQEPVLVTDFLMWGDSPQDARSLLFERDDLIGLILSSFTDETAIRAMMLCFPHAFGEFGVDDGAVELPVVENPASSPYRKRIYSHDEDTAPLPDSQIYRNAFSSMMRTYRVAATKMFLAFGQTVDRDELKLMFVWGWK